MSDDLKALLEEAMHCLLHVDAHINERISVAKKLAEAIGHDWPPYEEKCEGCGDYPTTSDVEGVPLCQKCYDECVAEDPGHRHDPPPRHARLLRSALDAARGRVCGKVDAVTLRESLERYERFFNREISYDELHDQNVCEHGVRVSRLRCLNCAWIRHGINALEAERAAYASQAVKDEGFLGELLRTVSDRLARLVTPGDVGVIP